MKIQKKNINGILCLHIFPYFRLICLVICNTINDTGYVDETLVKSKDFGLKY